jgi:hypothetical protein
LEQDINAGATFLPVKPAFSICIFHEKASSIIFDVIREPGAGQHSTQLHRHHTYFGHLANVEFLSDVVVFAASSTTISFSWERIKLLFW